MTEWFWKLFNSVFVGNSDNNIAYHIGAIIAMILATYIPRAVPLLFFRKQIQSRFWLSFLFYIPYAVLSALTFPAIFYSTGNSNTAIIGTLTALVMSFYKINLAIVAVVCIIIVFFVGML